MMLICGSAQDCLIQEVVALDGAAQEMVHVEESHLFNWRAMIATRVAEKLKTK